MTPEEIQELLPTGFHAFGRDSGSIDIYDEALKRNAGQIVNNLVVINNPYKMALYCHLDRSDLGLTIPIVDRSATVR